jgi:hypothetical protein
LLLQRELGKAGAAGSDRGTEDRTRGRSDRRTPAAADGRTEAGAECCREDRAPHRLIGRGIGLGCCLARGKLLTHSLIGGKGAELLVRAGDDRDRRRHRRRNACAESNRHRQNAAHSPMEMPHASPLLNTRQSAATFSTASAAARLPANITPQRDRSLWCAGSLRKVSSRFPRASRERLLLFRLKDQDQIRRKINPVVFCRFAKRSNSVGIIRRHVVSIVSHS